MTYRVATAICLLALLAGGATAQQPSASDARAGYEARERRLLADIAKRPHDARLHNELGVTQFYLGKGAAAEAAFQKAIQLDPKNADTRANLSFHYFQTGREEAALDLLRAALEIDPDNFLANYYSGLLYFNRQQPTRAEIFLRKALALQPGHLDAQLDLIKVRAAQGQLAEAEAALDRLATAQPNEARVRYARAAFYASLGRDAEAMSEYKTVLAIAPASNAVRLDMAVIEFRRRDFYAAIAHLEEFHQQGVSVESAYLMGHALAELGQREEAEKWVAQALAGREAFFDARLQMGRLLFARRDYAGAITHLRRAVELSEKSVEARYVLGFCYELTNQLDEALAQYEEILRLAPERFEGHHGAGSVKLKRDDVQGAVASLFRAARINPRDPDVQYLLGRALGRAGNNSGAIDHLALAVKLAPRRADARYQLGLALRKAGRVEEAAAQLKIVEELNTEFRGRGAAPEKQP